MSAAAHNPVVTRQTRKSASGETKQAIAPAGEWQYNGQPVHFNGAGWFNATQVAKRFGKRPNDWLMLAETTEYIEALNAISNTGQNGIWQKSKRGNNGGTWLHPKLAVAFARWLDMHFSVWCDMQIDHILRGGLSLWHKAGNAPSETPDREALLTAAAAVVARHRLPFSAVYEALNLFAGVAHARDMNCEQVVQSAEFGTRLLAGQATPGDFARIEQHRTQLSGESTQLTLPCFAEAIPGGA